MNTNPVRPEELTRLFKEGILNRWYPLVIDKEYGGYFTNVTYDWKIMPDQEKMIVSQARHIWTLSKASEFFGGVEEYENMARYGVPFLKEKMWDQKYGGFFQIRSRGGGISDVWDWKNEKRTYGNAFAVYALAALYRQTKDLEALEFAKTVFKWIDEHAYDPKDKGYFQFMTQEGKPFDQNSKYKTTAHDANELGLKDQNSSIHLLEALTELYHVWKDPLVKVRLQEVLELIRDRMVTKEGYLQLFFQKDWTPVSFRDSSKDEGEVDFKLDHVSFGHDYETAFLMLEASQSLGLSNDARTLMVAKKMLDHALMNGWDENAGGFYDGGYYFKGEDKCTIVKDTKNWWAQAEALNVLLLFSKIFPDDKRYPEFFIRQWDYVSKYIIDPERGDWFEGGLDKEPHFKTGPKSHMWKCTYHTGRTLMNCANMIKGDPDKEINRLIDHWRTTAEKF